MAGPATSALVESDKKNDEKLSVFDKNRRSFRIR